MTQFERSVRNSIGGPTKVVAQARATANPDGNVRLVLHVAGAEHGVLNLTRCEGAAMYAVLGQLLEAVQ